MSRWKLEGNADYYTRYRNYETYLRANAEKLGLSPAQVEEQLGRYSLGLQQKMQVNLIVFSSAKMSQKILNLTW